MAFFPRRSVHTSVRPALALFNSYGQTSALAAPTPTTAVGHSNVPSRPSAPDPPRFMHLPFNRTAPSIARHAVLDRTGQLGRVACEDAVLLTSELVTNAVRHGQPSIMLDMVVDDAQVLIRVGDHGPNMPRLPVAGSRPDDAKLSGRGLLIVHTIASRWGVDPFTVGPGKCVWFELS